MLKQGGSDTGVGSVVKADGAGAGAGCAGVRQASRCVVGVHV